MDKCKDMINVKINNLKYICSYRENKRTYWICKCDCGKFTIKRQDINKITDCGCGIFNMDLNNKTGQNINNFIIIEDFSKTEYKKYDKKQYKRHYCICSCKCGSIKEYRRESVLHSQQKSCGCDLKNKRHGMSGHYLYKTYNNIKSRCFNINNHAYQDYGARGISLHKEWNDNFSSFVNYIQQTIGDRPEGCTLDRIDNNKGYEIGNLRWANHFEQCNNKRQVKSNYGYNLLKEDCQILKDKNDYLLSIIGDLYNA